MGQQILHLLNAKNCNRSSCLLQVYISVYLLHKTSPSKLPKLIIMHMRTEAEHDEHDNRRTY